MKKSYAWVANKTKDTGLSNSKCPSHFCVFKTKYIGISWQLKINFVQELLLKMNTGYSQEVS